MNSLKEVHNLIYDESGFDSGLIRWYNQLIDKSYDDLNVVDVSKMIRQDVLKDIAAKRSIDLFFEDPYNGEYDDGGLLNMLASLNIEQINDVDFSKLKILLRDLNQSYSEFEWSAEETKTQFKENIRVLLDKLENM